MRFLKRLLLFIIGLLLIIVLVFWGFKENFPGKSIANALQLRLTTQTGIPVEIEDLASFIKEILDVYFVAVNKYLMEYNKLKKNRSVQGIMDL